jgi:rare lipoprotein A
VGVTRQPSLNRVAITGQAPRGRRTGVICHRRTTALLIRMASRFASWALVALTLFLHGCAREQPSQSPRVGPAVPAGGATSMSGAGCSDEEGRQQPRQTLRGLATYYHDSLSGNLTASGERYDPEDFSAAHRTLPFGTRLRVRRTDMSGSPVCVTVNDRGPFAGKKRVVDVSRRAAEHLEMVSAGVVPVLVEVL